MKKVIGLIVIILSLPVIMIVGIFVPASNNSTGLSDGGILEAEEVVIDFDSKYYTFNLDGVNGSPNVCDVNGKYWPHGSTCTNQSTTGSFNKMICASYASSRFWEVNYPNADYPLPTNWNAMVSITHRNPDETKFDYSNNISDVKARSIVTIKFPSGGGHALFIEGIDTDGTILISEANVTKANQYGWRCKKWNSINEYLSAMGATFNSVLTPTKENIQ